MHNGTNHRILVLSFIGFLSLSFTALSQTISQPPQPGFTGKPVDHFVFTTTVTNEKGDFISRLRKGNFQIFLDKELVNIVDVSESDGPLSIGIVLDVSASLPGQGREKAGRALINSMQQALKSFLGLTNKSNEYFLMAFNQRPQLLQDWTSDSDSLVNSLSVVQPKGNTALFDACYLALNKMQQARYTKRVLILISDGLDNSSTYSFKQVREALKGSDVLLYSIYLSDLISAGTSLGQEGQNILKELTSLSGGMFFYGAAGRLKDTGLALEIIADELGHQYLIGIQPQTSKLDGKWHKLKIKVELPANAAGAVKRVSTRTREGFYLDKR